MKDTLAIVNGAGSALGQAYLEELSIREDIESVGITRTEPQTMVDGITYKSGVDLLDQEQVTQVIEATGCREALKILLIHAVGKFKFEEHIDMHGTDDIDEEILLSNYSTLVHSVLPIVQNMRHNTSLVVCGFGSVSDKYDIPFWQSYTHAKNRMRVFLKDLASGGINMRSVIVNVSTTDTGNENLLRPNADKSYWLKPAKIVDQSLPVLLEESPAFYQEMNVIEPKPGFEPDAYYSNTDAVLKKWREDMGQ